MQRLSTEERAVLSVKGMSRCSACGEAKPSEAFSPRTATSVQSRCKACCAAAAARFRQEHPEQHKANVRRRYRERRDILLARTREWRAANKEHVRAQKREWEAKNQGKVALMYLRKRAKAFGLSGEQYAAINTAQGGRCAICGRHESEFSRKLSIDHDHETGRVRGLLCGPCNTMIGQAQESIATLERAIAYLIEHGLAVAEVA